LEIVSLLSESLRDRKQIQKNYLEKLRKCFFVDQIHIRVTAGNQKGQEKVGNKLRGENEN